MNSVYISICFSQQLNVLFVGESGSPLNDLPIVKPPLLHTGECGGMNNTIISIINFCLKHNMLFCMLHFNTSL